MNKTIIAGKGQIGTALGKVLSDYKPKFFDVEPSKCDFFNEAEAEGCQILHITFPYSEFFKDNVLELQDRFHPDYTVIHSTVPPGTNRFLGSISSPVLGIHPNLESGIRTFTKFLGGEKAGEVADYFRRAGMKVYIVDKPETCELMKILDTTFYGVCVEYTKDVKRQCDKFGVPFEAWTLWTNNYNEGYWKLGFPEYTRPNLVPVMKKIGGHCVLNNTSLLETPFTEFIKKMNETN